MKKFVLLMSCVIALSLVFGMQSSHAGWLNNAKQKAAEKYNKTKSKYNEYKSNAKSKYNKAKEGVSNFKNKTKNTYTKSKSKAKSTFRKAQDKLKSGHSKLKDKATSGYEKYKTKTQSGYNRFKNKAKKLYDKNRQNEKLGKIKSNIIREGNKRWSSLRAFSKESIREIEEYGRQYGPKAKSGVMNLLAAGRGGAKEAGSLLRRNVDVCKKWAKDPEKRKKVVAGVVVATAVMYYGYKHQDDIKYTIIKSTLSNVKVPVDGEMVSADEFISGAICKNAPFLSHTEISNDISAVIAYGITATSREDIINNVPLVPDKSGNVRTINEAVSCAKGADEVLSALQLGSSIEGMAMVAAEEGHLGIYGRQFSGAYKMMEKNFEQK